MAHRDIEGSHTPTQMQLDTRSAPFLAMELWLSPIPPAQNGSDAFRQARKDTSRSINKEGRQEPSNTRTENMDSMDQGFTRIIPVVIRNVRGQCRYFIECQQYSRSVAMDSRAKNTREERFFPQVVP